jgi:AcrR family transcriptional regulator
MEQSFSSENGRRKRGRPKLGEFNRPLKDLLIEATVQIVSQEGTTDASARRVCDAVGVQPASINYNFGSWNALIAHAALTAYYEYSAEIWSAALAAPTTPEDRLSAFLRAQIAWAERESGWSAFFNFPRSAQTASDFLFERFGRNIQDAFELNYGRLYRLCRDVREGVVTGDEQWAEKTGRDAILADTDMLTEAIVVGWTSLGMQIWGSRHQADVLGGDHLRDYNARAQQRAIDTLITHLRSLT